MNARNIPFEAINSGWECQNSPPFPQLRRECIPAFRSAWPRQGSDPRGSRLATAVSRQANFLRQWTHPPRQIGWADGRISIGFRDVRNALAPRRMPSAAGSWPRQGCFGQPEPGLRNAIALSLSQL